MTDRSSEKRPLTAARRRLLIRLAWPTGVVITLLALMLFVDSPFTEGEPPQLVAVPPAAQGLPVEAVQVRVATALRELTAVGTLQSNESVVIAAEVAGRIAEISFAEGEKVAAGKVLLRLDPSVLAAERDRAQASLELSQANHQRADSLLKDRAISEQERDEAYSQWRLDEANLRLAEAQLAKMTIRAPFAGMVGLRRISIGGYLRSGDAVVTLDAVDPIKVDFRVPEVYADQVKVGQTIRLNVDAVPGQIFSGKVYAIDPQVDANGRSVLLRARVANTGGPLRQGMFARISLVMEERVDALLIPEEALMTKGEQQTVFKIVDGKAETTTVKIGLRNQGSVEIMEGLQQGDTVVTAGHLKIRPGMAVTVLPTTAPVPQSGG